MSHHIYIVHEAGEKFSLVKKDSHTNKQQQPPCTYFRRKGRQVVGGSQEQLEDKNSGLMGDNIEGFEEIENANVEGF